MKLMEIKKVTKEKTNELIRSISEVDANLILALKTLDDVYQNNIKVAELATTDLIAATRVSSTTDSVMKAYIPIMTAENTLKGMSLSSGQRGELLLFVMAESNLNNPLMKAWETLYHVLQNNINVAELTNTLAPRVSNTLDSVMKEYITIVTAEETLKGINLTDSQRGDLLFYGIAESKLNNPLSKMWEKDSAWGSRQSRPIEIKIEISQLSRSTFWKCRDFLDCRDLLSDSVKIESLNLDTIKTNQDPQP
jgi:hypothetical protein